MTLDESLTGWIGIGQSDPVQGRVHGEAQGTRLTMHARLVVQQLRAFLEQPDHAAQLEGTIDLSSVGQAMVMQDGVFNVFVVNPRTGARQMVYEARFSDSSGKRYFLRGVKHLSDDPGFDVLEDMTTLFTMIYEGDDDQGAVFGAGQVYFPLSTMPGFLRSLHVTGNPHSVRPWRRKSRFYPLLSGKYATSTLPISTPSTTLLTKMSCCKGKCSMEPGVSHSFSSRASTHRIFLGETGKRSVTFS